MSLTGTKTSTPEGWCARKVYLAGPMTHIPHFNFPAFYAAAKDLRERGFDVTSPAELDSPEAKAAAEASPDGAPGHYAENDSWGTLLARDVLIIADEGIDAIVCLPGWQNSRGAKLETFVARLCKIPLIRYPTLSPIRIEEIDQAHGHEQLAKQRLEILTRNAQDKVFKPDEYLDDLPKCKCDPFPIWTGETRVTDPSTGGQKGSKLAQLGALDPDALLEVAKVAGFGAQKYAYLNYMRGFKWSLAYDAMQRHLHEFWAGREVDEESGLPHMSHAAWQCLCLLSFSTRGLGTDDRICSGRYLDDAVGSEADVSRMRDEALGRELGH